MEFIENIINQAKTKNAKIVLPESEDERILRATEIIKNENIAIPVLIGDPEKIKNKCVELNINLENIEIIDLNKIDVKNYAEKFYELRKHKGINYDQAKEIMMDPIYYATMMVYFKDADCLVSGACHSTSSTIRPALQIIKTKENFNTVSSFFFMIKEEQIFLFSDCGVNINPDSEQLAEIAISTANSAKEFNISPKIAMLSFSTKGSAKHELADKVIKATQIVNQKRPDLIVDGEMQLDTALVPEVAMLKAPNSLIKGDANVLIFPDLNSGNIGYKLVERIAQAKALGPILQGLKKPVNDLSRGCSVRDIVEVVAITAVQSK